MDFERRQQLKHRKMNEERKYTAASSLLVLYSGQDVCEAMKASTSAFIEDISDISTGTYTQTEMMASQIQSTMIECKNLRNENIDLKKKLKISSLELDSFKENDDKVRYFTGLPSFTVMFVIFNFICAHLSVKSTLSAFQQFLLTCMRL